MSENTLKEVKFYDVPTDSNNCMLHSISFAYLLPVLKDQKELKNRIKKLFGEKEEKSFIELKNFLEEIYLRLDTDYLKFIIENNKSNNDNIWNKNIKNLRIRVIDFMKKNESQFPTWLNESLYKDNKELWPFSKEEYKEATNEIYLGSTMLESTHACALNKMLKTSIIILSDYNSNQETKFIEKNSFEDPIYLKHSHNHYNFGLNPNQLNHSNILPPSSKKEIILSFIRRCFYRICSFFHSLFFFKKTSSSQEEKEPLIAPKKESESENKKTTQNNSNRVTQKKIMQHNSSIAQGITQKYDSKKIASSSHLRKIG